MKIVIQHLTGISDATAHALLDSFPGAAERLNDRAWVVRHTLFTAAQKRELIEHAHAQQIDVACLERDITWADFKVLAMDMDSTLINIECVDEIADAVGRKTEVAAITEAAMRGEITDFKDSLRQRVGKLVGVTEADMARVLTERLRLTPGADTLVRAAQAAGLKVLLVSGGFTYFAEHVRGLLDIDFVRANVLELKDGALTGGLVEQAWGDICDGAEKRRTLLEVASLIGIDASQCIAVGDGSNDIPMMQAAGLSVAYHAKPRVRAEAKVCINEGGLDRLLELLR